MSVCFTISACATQDNQMFTENFVNVVLAEGEGYECLQHIKSVERGSSVVFDISLENGYDVERLNYADSEIRISTPDTRGVRSGQLFIYNVRYPTYIELETKEVSKIYSVQIICSDIFECAYPLVSIEEGGTAVFELICNKDYIFSSCNYSGEYSFSNGMPDAHNMRKITLSLFNVVSDCSVTLNASPSKESLIPDPVEGYATIGYSSNGGVCKDNGEEGTKVFNYALKTQFRPNTELGWQMFQREGYTLTGWNTEKDLSGEHIGLGSKYSVEVGKSAILFAEWAKCTDEGLFEYSLIAPSDIGLLYACENAEEARKKLEELSSQAGDEKCAVLTAYNGKGPKLVIPENVGGYRVAAIACGFAGNFNGIKSLVLPFTLSAVMSGAFTDCLIEELYIYDSLKFFHKDAICGNNLKVLHINAGIPPVYGDTPNAQFANKVEMLIANEGKRRAVFFGSCSTWYGLDENTLENRNTFINGEIMLNMGVIGGTCALIQIDIINNYLVSRMDKFIYLIEAGSEYQLLLNYDLDLRSFIGMESNYDLLSFVDMTRYTNVLAALSDYLLSKNNYYDMYGGGSYEDIYSEMNEHGFLVSERVHEEYAEEYELLDFGKLTDGIMLANMLSMARELNADMYIGFSPLSEMSVNKSEVEEFDRLFAQQFSLVGYSSKLICGLSDSVMSRKYFCDSSYHLTSEGAVEFSKIISDKIKDRI